MASTQKDLLNHNFSIFKGDYGLANGVSTTEGDILCVNSGGYVEQGLSSNANIQGVLGPQLSKDLDNSSGADGALKPDIAFNRFGYVEMSGSHTKADFGKQCILTTNAQKLAVSGAVDVSNVYFAATYIKPDVEDSDRALVFFDGFMRVV